MKKISYIENIEEWKRGFLFYHEVKVRFSETDMFGHLNNTIPFTYFEDARVEYFKSKGFMQEWVNIKHHSMPVVADLQCDFLKQVYFDEVIKVYVKVQSVGRSSVDIHYMGVNNKEDICFTGRGTIVQISKQTGKGLSWSDEMKDQLQHDAFVVVNQQ
jgi:acyl-CoA thioester hydrolase